MVVLKNWKPTVFFPVLPQDSLETVLRCLGLGLGLEGWCLGVGLGMVSSGDTDSLAVSVSQETTPSAMGPALLISMILILAEVGHAYLVNCDRGFGRFSEPQPPGFLRPHNIGPIEKCPIKQNSLNKEVSLITLK